ncbi:MAG TPA: hypothetical protein VM470_02700 [Acidimicrobiia bacterium]|nr:hypothetical protein [Acidimicrobiia bacterium]
MTPLIFGYSEARRISQELELNGRRVDDSGISIKDIPFKERVGRALIHWGEQLVPVIADQDRPDRNARHAA